jgi:nucleotide-binding universal stress UspA family protein
MMQSTSAPLLPPLLLATDGSLSAQMAQRLIVPLAQILPTDATTSTRVPLEVLTVQPRPVGLRARGLPSLAGFNRKPSTEPRAVEAPPEPNPSNLENGELLESSLLELQITPTLESSPACPINFQSREGRPATEILNHARTIQAGLIAVGHRGIGGSRELLLGSVSSAIARYAASHVLVARGLPEDPNFQPRWDHVLLAVNGSQATKQAIALTHQLLSVGIQRITILCAQTPLNPHHLFGPFATPTPSWQLTQSLQQAQKEQSEWIIQKAQEKLSAPNIELETFIQIGEPGPLICQMAAQQQVDMIILGSDRQPAFRHTRLTATGDYALHHAPCPVLLCRMARADIEPPLDSSSEV